MEQRKRQRTGWQMSQADRQISSSLIIAPMMSVASGSSSHN